MEVEATLFTRADMPHLGIAPLTSMFLFDDMDRNRFDDFRPAVHDSDGLLIHNGAGEVIWRPLANPTTLQLSAFSDNNPRGFGLMQRKRDFGDFNDLESLYHRRPGLWVTPGEGWERGSVYLVEIPADREIYDNIVAYWRPADGIAKGARHDMTYRLDWGLEPEPTVDMPLRVLNTAAGGRPEGGRIFAIDFEASDKVPEDLGQITRLIRTSAGEVSEGSCSAIRKPAARAWPSPSMPERPTGPNSARNCGWRARRSAKSGCTGGPAHEPRHALKGPTGDACAGFAPGQLQRI